ncbi:hypothetical protein WG66_013922, partial [Moniliophthora roreri]
LRPLLPPGLDLRVNLIGPLHILSYVADSDFLGKLVQTQHPAVLHLDNTLVLGASHRADQLKSCDKYHVIGIWVLSRRDCTSGLKIAGMRNRKRRLVVDIRRGSGRV